MNKIGWLTEWKMPSNEGRCNWFLCNKSATYGGFCEEHGGIKVKGTVVDEKNGQDKEASRKNDGKNKGYHKTYS